MGRILLERERGEGLNLKPATSALIVRYDLGGVHFLLAKRLEKPGGRLEEGRYSPPGGKFELADCGIPEWCVIREAWEETGMIIGVDDLKAILYRGRQGFTVSGQTFDHHGFLVIWEKRMGEPENKEPQEHDSWEWYSERKVKEFLADDKLSAVAAKLLEAYGIWETDQLEQIRDNFRPVLEEDVEVPRLLPD